MWLFLRYGGACGDAKIWQLQLSGLRTLWASVPPWSPILATLFKIPHPHPTPEAISRGHGKMACPVDVNLAGQLDIIPEAWGSVGTEPPESILEGQMSLANSGWQPTSLA